MEDYRKCKEQAQAQGAGETDRRRARARQGSSAGRGESGDQASEIRYRRLFESAQDGILIVDPEAQCVCDANPFIAALAGRPREEMIGKNLCELGLFQDMEAWNAALERLKEQGVCRIGDLSKLTSTGEMRDLEVICNLYDENGRRIIQCNVRDITERKQAERELAAAKERLAAQAGSLEQQVAEKTAALRETLGELESFSYSIAHDLRGPLRAMQNFAHLLEEECGEQIETPGKDYLRRIRTAADRMDKLTEAVLNYSRLGVERLPLARVDLKAALRGIIEFYPNLQAPHADITLEGAFPQVMANDGALTLCIANLLSNAVKFVPQGVQPRVQTWAATFGNRVRLFFKDNGMGVEDRDRERIFELFQRAGSGFEGAGIGLAIVKKAAERMGGRVGLHSEPGRGSTFWLELISARD